MEETLKQSKFRIVSFGYVVANKPLRTYTIEAVPIEDMPMFSGEMTDNTEEYKASAKGGEDGGDPVELALKTTASVQAEWIPLGNTNRLSAPDVRRGEPVLLYQFADSDKYFWSEWKHAHKLRRLETITYLVSNERNENVPLNNDNTYFFFVSTHEKLIHIRTTKSDGEPFAYDIQLDTKRGRLVIQDDARNHMMLDSKERHIQFQNGDDSVVELNKKIINLKSVDEINLTTKRYTLKASDSITEQTRAHTTKSSSYTQTASSYKSSCPTFNFNGNGDWSSNFSIGGNLSVSGTSSHKGQSTGPGHR